MKKLLISFMFLLAACSITSNQSRPIEEAAKKCNISSNVADQGKTITFDTKGDEDASGDSFESVACVLYALKIPDRVVNKLDSTRALDGTLEDSWDSFYASWNYHPDNGLHLTVYQK